MGWKKLACSEVKKSPDTWGTILPHLIPVRFMNFLYMSGAQELGVHSPRNAWDSALLTGKDLTSRLKLKARASEDCLPRLLERSNVPIFLRRAIPEQHMI